MNSNNNQREFALYINDELVWNPSGIARGWVSSPAFEVPVGYNEFRLEFDRYQTYGCRCVRIDNIRFTQVDVDEDLIRDDWELANGLDPSDPTDALLDPDGDGLNNYGEYIAGTDLNVADTDGDGVNDGDEINVYDSDPLDTDTDDDNMPDGFEVSNGLDPLDSADAAMPTTTLTACRTTASSSWEPTLTT